MISKKELYRIVDDYIEYYESEKKDILRSVNNCGGFLDDDCKRLGKYTELIQEFTIFKKYLIETFGE